MTETELMSKIREILAASKEDIENRHHELFPSERASVRGVHNLPKIDMQVDILIDLFQKAH